jgi:hypothetical protein
MANTKGGKVDAGAPSSPSNNEQDTPQSVEQAPEAAPQPEPAPEPQSEPDGETADPSAVGPFAPEEPVGKTRTDDNVNKPSTVYPGEAPYDTKDPNERVSTVPHAPDEEALRAGTVNAVLVNPALPQAHEVRRNLRGGGDANGNDRVETYQATRPNGEQVTVRHNLDTGETSVA